MKSIGRAILVGLNVCLLSIAGSRGDEPREPSGAGNEEVPATILAWDGTEKEQSLVNDETIGAFEFVMTNSSDQEVEVTQINTSCGCTSVAGRATPFTLKPGEKEALSVRMNVVGKTGEITKSIFVITNRGNRTLLATAKIAPSVESEPSRAISPDNPGSAMRDQNLAAARTDRQAVFQGDCAACHVKPTEGKSGEALYQSACGICHDAEHRAKMVPDLRIHQGPRDAAYWTDHISNGRAGTLMPAFAKTKQGVLTEEQIASLVRFLTESPPQGSRDDNSKE